MIAYVTTKGGVVQSVDYDAVQSTLVDPFYDGSTYRDLFKQGASEGPTGFQGGHWYPAADNQGFQGGFGATQALKARLSDEIAHKAPRDLATRQTRLRFFKEYSSQVSILPATDAVACLENHQPSPGDSVIFVLRARYSNGVLAPVDFIPAGAGMYSLAPTKVYFVKTVSGGVFTVSTSVGGAVFDIVKHLDWPPSGPYDLNTGGNYRPGTVVKRPSNGLYYRALPQLNEAPLYGLVPGSAIADPTKWEVVAGPLTWETEMHCQFLTPVADFKPGEWKSWSNEKPRRF